MSRKYFKYLFYFFIIFFFLLTYSLAYEEEVNKVCTELSEKIKESGIKTVAILDLSNLEDKITELGKLLAVEISISLSRVKKDFKVIDRTHLISLLREYKLSYTGLIDLDTMKRIGKIIGVDAIITGYIFPLEKNYRLTLVILKVETAEQIWGTAISISRDKTMDSYFSRIITPELPQISLTQIQEKEEKIIDNIPPKVSISFPKKDSLLSGKVNIQIFAQDNEEIRRVEFYIDNNKIGELNKEPFTLELDTKNTQMGSIV